MTDRIATLLIAVTVKLKNIGQTVSVAVEVQEDK